MKPSCKRHSVLLLALWWALGSVAYSENSLTQKEETQEEQNIPELPGEQEEGGEDLIVVEMDKKEIRLGEPIEISIRVQSEKDSKAVWPSNPDLAPFILLSQSESIESYEPKSVQVFRIKMATYEKTGTISLKNLKFMVRTKDEKDHSELKVPEISIRVTSVLEGVEKPEARDIAGPIAIKATDYRPFAFLAIVLGFVLLALSMRFSGNGLAPQTRQQPIDPLRPAHEIALEKLEQIVSDDLLRKGKIREYFIRVSETAREYLGNRYGFFAMDLTSRELIEELRDRPTIGLDLAGLKTMLQDSDLVKFAKIKATDEMASQAMDYTFAMVDATREKPQKTAGEEKG